MTDEVSEKEEGGERGREGQRKLGKGEVGTEEVRETGREGQRKLGKEEVGDR